MKQRERDKGWIFVEFYDSLAAILAPSIKHNRCSFLQRPSSRWAEAKINSSVSCRNSRYKNDYWLGFEAKNTNFQPGKTTEEKQ